MMVGSYKDISWDMVFDGSYVKCNRCLNLIRNMVLRQNPDVNVAEPKGNEQRMMFVDESSNWAIKVVAEAKELANDPTWCCNHPPDETYFVQALLMGVKAAMENYTTKTNTCAPRPKKNDVCEPVVKSPTPTQTPVEKFMGDFFINEGTQVDALKIECGSQA